MIDNLVITNFKSHKNIHLAPRALTVLAGKNGVGKSSVLQSLLLLAQKAQETTGIVSVGFKEAPLKLGTLADVFCADAEGGEDSIGFLLSVDGEEYETNISVSADILDHTAVPMEIVRTSKTVADYLKSIRYISADRLEPRHLHAFARDSVAKRFFGVRGENAVAILHHYRDSGAPEDQVVAGLHGEGTDGDGNLGRQVDAWMKSFAEDMRVRTEMVGDTDVRLTFRFGYGLDWHDFSPENVGFGISAVLPLVIMVLASRPGECLIMENPETHVHPRGQAEFGRLLALAAHAGVQIFVETHSDHIINGIRVAVKENTISPDEVDVVYFAKHENGTGTSLSEIGGVGAKELELYDDGDFAEYPPGFLDEWTDQLTKLL